ncbi:hypothetical protein [Streptomyces sp. NPDC048057]|uniref:SCO4225 family membrane protein n=1 Tax=Streptomyces sp. NPDC048057 TaxID=3155628 RepID=UPI0033D449BD
MSAFALMRSTVHRFERGKVAMTMALAYAAVVIGLALWIEMLSLFGDVGFAGIWLGLATFPSSLPIMMLPVYGHAWLLLQTAAGLGQAWLLWRLLRGASR